MKKAYESSLQGATVVCLVPARTDTHWWHDYAMKGEIRLLRGRLKFGDAVNSAPFPSAIVVFRPGAYRLTQQQAFYEHGEKINTVKAKDNGFSHVEVYNVPAKTEVDKMTGQNPEWSLIDQVGLVSDKVLEEKIKEIKSQYPFDADVVNS